MVSYGNKFPVDSILKAFLFNLMRIIFRHGDYADFFDKSAIACFEPHVNKNK